MSFTLPSAASHSIIIAKGQEKETTKQEDHCLVIRRTKPTHGTVADGDVPWGSDGPVTHAGDFLKEGGGTEATWLWVAPIWVRQKG